VDFGDCNLLEGVEEALPVVARLCRPWIHRRRQPLTGSAACEPANSNVTVQKQRQRIRYGAVVTRFQLQQIKPLTLFVTLVLFVTLFTGRSTTYYAYSGSGIYEGKGGSS